MAAMYDLTADDIQMIRDFVQSGDPKVLDSDAISTFNALHAALAKKLAAYAVEKTKHASILERKIQRKQKREEQALIAGEFTETQRDSVDVTTMLLYHLQQKGYNMTKNKVVHILYLMYASWLYSKKERLFMEHPCATEWGPQFWRVYSRLDVRKRVDYQQYISLAKQDPAAAAFCKRAAEKYFDYNENTLKANLLRSTPYKNALPDHNGGKWNKEISDSDIWFWKQENDHSAKNA